MKILLTILLSLASVSEAKSSKRRSRRSHSYDEISSSKLEQTKAVRDIYKIMSRHRKTDRAFSCFRYQHGNRGSLSRKTGYVKGMVLSMVRSQCRSKDDLAKQYMLKGRSSRSDALFKYRKSDEKNS